MSETYPLYTVPLPPPKETKPPKSTRNFITGVVPCCGKTKVLADQRMCRHCQKECCRACARNKHESHGELL